MPSRTTTILLAAAAVATIAVLANKKAPEGPPIPKPDPIPGTQGGPAPIVTILAMTSRPDAGPTHNGVLRSDGSWTISTTTGSLVAQASTGEAAFLTAWDAYTTGGVDGSIVRSGVLSGFAVRPPGCAAGAPSRWCYTTTWQPGLTRRSPNRADAISKALARTRAGA